MLLGLLEEFVTTLTLSVGGAPPIPGTDIPSIPAMLIPANPFTALILLTVVIPPIAFIELIVPFAPPTPGPPFASPEPPMTIDRGRVLKEGIDL